MTPTRYVLRRRPLPVPGSPQPMSHAMFVDHLLDSCPQFTKTGTGLRAAGRIAAAVRAVPDGGHYALEEPDHKMLAEAAENPAEGYPKLFMVLKDGTTKSDEIGRHLVLFVDDIVGATCRRPDGEEVSEEISLPVPNTRRNGAAARRRA